MSGLAGLRLLATAFDLSSPNERQRSANELAGFYLDLVTGIRPDVTVEIGAFDARFSKEMKRRLPASRAIAFEASPFNYELVAPDAATAGIEYIHAAVSDADGTTTFNVMSEYRDQRFPRVKGNDSLLQRTDAGVVYEQVVVPSITANSFFDRPEFDSSRLCLWIDVEGAAEKVLRGANGILNRTQSIFIEVEDYRHWEGQWLSHDVDAGLYEFGFTPIARDFEYDHQYNVVYVNTTTMSSYWFDLFLTKFYSRLRVPLR